MEASVILRLSCVSAEQCQFVQHMLGKGDNRPLFEDEVTEAELPWFQALEDISDAESVGSGDATTLYASWTLGGPNWDEDALETIDYLKQTGVKDIYTVVVGDEGWYELWIMQEGKLVRLNEWKSQSLERLFDGSDDLTSVLDTIYQQNQS